ncbi:unnamed protein product [Acanthoscelides obtectus]|uniref:COMM domain-containing protein 3 n=1 Tax=Acanthoscelides obtectus TaxID=200917 RepID=A0A9P0P4Q8_ACAOB|nr:unnamed protein product [Acanthoscelides obtectus]CAH1966781.1 unnamed protein product [Acanthoscelides obtectus]CAK1658254.1 COMM domain-containing protein 3 [Acanthoscelides obtectus]CAK1658255.1 COMM domain-containing protein 3 [Acanthoscelides obtectus]
MELSEKYADVSKYIPTLNDEAFKKLTQNCISYLTENGEIHNLSSISAAKGDIVKYLYAFLLTITSQFARKRSSSEEIVKHLSHYGIHSARAEWYADQFRKHDKMLTGVLLNIGTYLPHIVDIRWKMAFTVKTLELDAVDGPVFMILLVTQKYDLAKEETVTKEIAFRCTVNELQDLVFKIKDAVRHCSVLSKGIL